MGFGEAGASAAQRAFPGPLRHISFEGQGSTPIWAAHSYDPGKLEGISERFLEKADVYTATYTHSENILELLERAFSEFGIPVENVRTVLDFGTGPGTNTVFPLHVIDPTIRVVATDISLNLLAILSRLMDDYPHRRNVELVAWDCTRGGIREGGFDLVVGISLLHHLIDPRKALRTAHQALRPGGHAIFVDPFDGAGLIRGLYEVLLATPAPDGESLAAVTRQALAALSRDYEARLAGSEPHHFLQLEDKWIFSPEWIQDEGRRAGFRNVVVRGNHTYERMYRDYVLTQLRIAAGPEAALLPAWALRSLDAFDASMTPAARKRMMLEATIVMTK